MSTLTCSACGSKISHRFFRQHLTKSTNAACKALLDKLDGILEDGDDSPTVPCKTSLPNPNIPQLRRAESPTRSESPIEADHAGDAFGNYADHEGDFAMGFDDNINMNPIPKEEREQEDNGPDGYESDANNAESEEDLEPERPGAPEDGGEARSTTTEPPPQGGRSAAAPVIDRGYTAPHIVHYGNSAGSPISVDSTADEAYRRDLSSLATGVYYPFTSRLEWEFARWAKLHVNLSASAVTDLLSIEGNSVELNKIVDTKIPGQRPRFQQSSFELEGEVFEIYHRDCAPEQHYTDDSCETRLYHDMHTGDWWWSTQEELDKSKRGGTIIPIILSSDKTQLTLFRNKSAYPLYLTIGNIPKEIRRRPSYRAYVLLAYLPTSRLLHIRNKAARRRCLLNVYHSCLTKILSPLVQSGREGMDVADADGAVYRGHLIYAAFVGDYPEQVQTTCTITGECVQCPASHNCLQDFDIDDANTSWRPLNRLLDALDNLDDDPQGYRDLASELRVKPVVAPFWKDLPLAHVYRSITPDVLHQLYQGVIKHLISWLTEACGAAEIDARCRRLPPNHNTHLFMKGITTLRWGLKPPVQLPLQRSVRAILDFLYLAQYPVHTSTTLNMMEAALSQFHLNKHVFVTLGIRENFNIPKLHFASHYVRSSRLLGTTDNFNTEYTERLHIDLAKDAYQATNHKDEFTQMSRWLERKEKMFRHEQFIHSRLQSNFDPTARPAPSSVKEMWIAPGLDHRRFLKMTKNPTCRSVSLDRIQNIDSGYGAPHFLPALSRFILLANDPSLTRQILDRAVENTFLPCRYLPLWHSIKYHRLDPLTQSHVTADIIHAHPSTRDGQGRRVPARFDTWFFP
ncbi:hypothetical protein D9611_012561 [Ephemerocybe angulata]|uniref:Uncharacterized protein n=1 Tax=Ephemerocybe angulata TaxID=980116 RepID=A0A8H5AV54_9AGAR|nr:hypothetical protein D9611_012561 [Tulosesus angulatus]